MEASAATTETWVTRVAEWRASGERAEVFSRRGGYAASTLRWWASRIKCGNAGAQEAAPARAPGEVRLARVVRTTEETTTPRAVVVVEVTSTGVRVAVESGADRTTLATVFEALGIAMGGRR